MSDKVEVNGKMVKRTSVGWKYRKAETESGVPIEVGSNAIYTRNSDGSLIRRDRIKPGKAAKRAEKKLKVKALKLVKNQISIPMIIQAATA